MMVFIKSTDDAKRIISAYPKYFAAVLLIDPDWVNREDYLRFVKPIESEVMEILRPYLI
jgi:hypothetical protein